MKKKRFLTTAIIIIVFTSSLFCEDPNGIIKKVDQLMYPNSKTELNLRFEKKGKLDSEYKMTAYGKSLNQKIIIRFTYPGTVAGNDMIFMEKNVWQFDKQSGRIINIP